jgi:serine/threonine-protein kinase
VADAAAPFLAFPALPAGSHFAGRYEIHSLLGRGGMGSVYRAHDQRLGEDVAIKIAHAPLEQNDALLDRLRREVAAGRRITHANVIRVHDLGEYAGRLYVSMEYFPGEPLSALVQRLGPMAPAQVRAIIGQVLDALAAAHGAGVVHRDVKPQNVLLGAEARVKVIDFGLAFAAHMQALTATGLIMGTPEYMSPEQIRGEPVDARADLYATGCLTQFLLTGAPPFTADSPIAVGFAHLRRDAPPPSSVRRGLAPGWDAFCARLLAKAPAARFATAAEARAALEAIG